MGAKKIDGLIIQRIDGELLVVTPATQEAHALNETAAIVFELCDGQMDNAAIAVEVARRTGLPADEGVVALALADLADAGLVILDEPAGRPITRRAVMRRLALPAAALALLPIVETVLVPHQAAGVSPPPAPTITPTPTPTPTPSPSPSPSPSPTPTPSTSVGFAKTQSKAKSTVKKPRKKPTPKP